MDLGDVIVQLALMALTVWLGFGWRRLPRVWAGHDTFTGGMTVKRIYSIHDRSYLTGLLPMTFALAAFLLSYADLRWWHWPWLSPVYGLLGLLVLPLIALQWYVNFFNRPKFLIPPVHRHRPGSDAEFQEAVERPHALRRAREEQRIRDGVPADMHLIVLSLSQVGSEMTLHAACEDCRWSASSVVDSLTHREKRIRAHAATHSPYIKWDPLDPIFHDLKRHKPR
ncbi:hypothetical protein Rhe02_74310 [Rhizocola hellebori]|uniref:Uncharacterized protein n=1 Tax=Rhizocola hellebori TaxID=1392758 RepID=A0A8J3QGR8_9ACTN|nr:hypothetical protein [Rhizocola hellebori]GIH09364.1 hypothetical protein Rhe02_74310 [Rhizocola hellebori]